MRSALLAASLAASSVLAQDGLVRAVLADVSEVRMQRNLEALLGFGVRDASLEPGNVSSGIGAAREHILAELRSYGPRLDVRVSGWPAGSRGGPVNNVVATLPGTSLSEEQILVTAHFDSRGGPGASDNGSGTAAVMELARVLSRHAFVRTLVFVLFSGEEYGLLGSHAEAEKAQREGASIVAVLNADIIANESPGGEEQFIDVYAGAAADSVSAALGQLARSAVEQYTPMRVNVKQAVDRRGRASDHMPYQERGFPAVRFVTPYEFVPDQHTPRDTMDRVSIPYVKLAAQAIASVAVSLAAAE
jgi:Zn-dependent M28 family amino/carboxypeptidase